MTPETRASATPGLAESDDTAIVLTTWPVGTDPIDLARALVGERLAACVNVLAPMRSVYTWKGEVADEEERQVIVKTRRSAVWRLLARLRELHPYDVPEFLVLPVVAGSAQYLAWIEESVTT